MADQETEAPECRTVADVVPSEVQEAPPEVQEVPPAYPEPPPAYPGPPLPGYQSTAVRIVYVPYPVPQGEPSQSSSSSHIPQHSDVPPCPVKGAQYSETASMLPADVQELVSRYGSLYPKDESGNAQTFESVDQVQTQYEEYPSVVITSQQHGLSTTSAEQQQQQRVDGKEPMTHLWLAVLVCCCCCPLIGAIAVCCSGKRFPF